MIKVSAKAGRILDALTKDLADPTTEDGPSRRKIANSTVFMPVVVERIGPNTYSVAHYGEQNGDLMRDPDMVFYRAEVGGEVLWYPVSFQNDYVGTYRVALELDADGKPVRFNAREQRDQASFTATWMKNIREQQGANLRGEVR